MVQLYNPFCLTEKENTERKNRGLFLGVYIPIYPLHMPLTTGEFIYTI